MSTRLDAVAIAIGRSLGHATRMAGRALDLPGADFAAGMVVSLAMDVAHSRTPNVLRGALIGATASFVHTVSRQG